MYINETNECTEIANIKPTSTNYFFTNTTLTVHGYLRDLPYTIPIDIIHAILPFYMTV